MKKIYLAAFLESSLLIAVIMAATGILLYMLWKMGILSNDQASLIIWGAEMALNGSLLMVLLPTVRTIMDGIPVREYHFIVVIAGALICAYTGASLASGISMKSFIYLPLPMIIVGGSMFLKVTLHGKDWYKKPAA